MTDRYMALVLEHDLREDDAAGLITALRQLKGVVDVRPVPGDIGSAMVANMQLKIELLESLRHWIEANLT